LSSLLARPTRKELADKEKEFNQLKTEFENYKLNQGKESKQNSTSEAYNEEVTQD
jgi:hypothetical protein